MYSPSGECGCYGVPLRNSLLNDGEEPSFDGLSPSLLSCWCWPSLPTQPTLIQENSVRKYYINSTVV